jgi:hypothetical protein
LACSSKELLLDERRLLATSFLADITATNVKRRIANEAKIVILSNSARQKRVNLQAFLKIMSGLTGTSLSSWNSLLDEVEIAFCKREEM